MMLRQFCRQNAMYAYVQIYQVNVDVDLPVDNESRQFYSTHYDATTELRDATERGHQYIDIYRDHNNNIVEFVLRFY